MGWCLQTHTWTSFADKIVNFGGLGFIFFLSVNANGNARAQNLRSPWGERGCLAWLDFMEHERFSTPDMMRYWTVNNRDELFLQTKLPSRIPPSIDNRDTYQLMINCRSVWFAQKREKKISQPGRYPNMIGEQCHHTHKDWKLIERHICARPSYLSGEGC